MNANQADPAWLQDPQVFEVKRLKAYSDHTFYKEVKGDLSQSLNGVWQFQIFENPDARLKNFYEPQVCDKNWNQIHVPAAIQCEGYLNHHYTNTLYPWDGIDDLRPPYISNKHNATAQYRTHFDVDPSHLSGNIILNFDGVETAFYVWLNGEFVGYSEDSFTPAHFDVTYLIKEKDNVLAVEVYQRSSASWLEDQDMWRLTGIFRDVTLSFFGPLHIYDLKTEQDIDLENNQAKLKVTCTNWMAKSGTIQASLFWQGVLVGQESASIENENVFEFQIDSPHLWSAEFANLYDLQLILADEAGIVEKVDQKIGLRKFEIEDGLLKINGKRIVFHGINRHEFSPQSGRALSKELMEFDAAFMKKNNINAVRTSHYPNHSYWYELADAYGIYLIDEANLETHGSWQKLGVPEPSWNIPGSKKEWLPAILDRAKSMVERDKNHPSVLIWSLGNEAYGGRDLIEMHDYIKKLDPSRPVHYEGITWCREFEEASDIESRMYAKPWDIEEYVANHPAKPYLSCEYEHAMGNSLGNIQEYADLEKYPAYQGGFIWDYVDQAIAVQKDGKTRYLYGGDFGDYPNDGNFCGDGIVLANRQDTPKTQEIKQVYRFVDLDVDPLGVNIHNRYLFDDLRDMYFVYTAKKDGQILSQGTFEVQVQPNSVKNVKIDWPKEEQEGIYTYTVTMHTKTDTPWAAAGHELAFGQKHSVLQKEEIIQKELNVIKGDGNVGVYSEGFSAYFSYVKGLISLKYDGQEMILPPIKPEFFRAFTDNDEGAGYLQSAGVWMAAGMFEKIVDCNVQNSSTQATISYTYQIPFVHEHCTLSYTIYGNGKIDVQAQLPANPDRALLPCFGVRMGVPFEMDQLTYMGKGPKDTYIDRDHAKMDVYHSSAEKEYVDYLRPQEHGNHTNTWWLRVENQEHQGFEVHAHQSPLQFSYLQHTPEELQLANHAYELPQAQQNTLRILSEQMGVGGDDTWGAPVHESYLIDNHKILRLNFSIQPLQ